MGTLEVQQEIELLRQAAGKVMALALALRAIHHADGALDAGLAELLRQRPVAQIQQEGLLRHLLEQGFMAARQWRIEGHGLGRAIPVRRRRDLTAGGTEAEDRKSVV